MLPIRRNAIFSAIEVIVGGLGLFLVYRNVVMELGVSMLGVWSIVLATTAFGRAADVGIASGLARFVARALAREDPAEAVLFVRTALVAVAVGMAVVALTLWLPFRWALAFALSDAQLALAQSLLPWALLTFWAMNVKGVFDAALLGVHRADLKSISNVIGLVLQVVGSLLLVKDYGLLGLAWAQAAQFIVAFVLSLCQLRIVIARRNVGLVRGWFSTRLFREMLGFGLKLQVSTIANLLFEPLTKIVLGNVGGTAFLGVYEMAYRMVYQVRAVAVMAQRTVLPTFVTLLLGEPERLRVFFVRTCRASAIAAAALLGTTSAASPLVSWLWQGKVDPTFIQLTAILAVSWAINVMAAPAIYFGEARGTVTANMAGMVLAGMLAPLLAWVLGTTLGGFAGVFGVVLGRLVADVLPAILNRPDPDLKSAAITQVENLVAVLMVLGFGAASVWISPLL